jgi:hypothetical protein
LETMVLTDGKVWQPDELYRYIEQVTVEGDHTRDRAGCESCARLARVGRGFAQIVSNEKDGMEGKVVSMLRGVERSIG